MAKEIWGGRPYDEVRRALDGQPTFEGEVLFVPSVQETARITGHSTGFLYSAGSYPEVLERSTGLTVVRRSGMVLAGEGEHGAYTPPDDGVSDPNTVDEAVGDGAVEQFARATECLGPQETSELISVLAGRLAIQARG